MLRSSAGLRSTAGFSLVEILVALFIIALLAGVVMTQVLGRTTSGEAAGIARNLSSVADAIAQFRTDVRRYPSELSYLTDPPGGGATDSCGEPIPVPFREAWRGPYLDRQVTGDGIRTGTAIIRNDLGDRPAGSPGTEIVIAVEGVDRAVAEEVERAFDATANLGGGTIRWTDQGGDRGELTFRMTARGC